MFVLPADLCGTCTREIRCLWKCGTWFDISVLLPYCRCQLCSSLDTYFWQSPLSKPQFPIAGVHCKEKLGAVPPHTHTSCATPLLQNLHSDASSLTVAHRVSSDVVFSWHPMQSLWFSDRAHSAHLLVKRPLSSIDFQLIFFRAHNRQIRCMFIRTNTKYIEMRIYKITCLPWQIHSNEANYTEPHVLSCHVRYPNVLRVCWRGREEILKRITLCWH